LSGPIALRLHHSCDRSHTHPDESGATITQFALWGTGKYICPIQNWVIGDENASSRTLGNRGRLWPNREWVNGNDLCSLSYLGFGSEDCPISYWAMRTDFQPSTVCDQGKAHCSSIMRKMAQEQTGRKTTRPSNMMPHTKTSWHVGQDEEMRRDGPLGLSCEARKGFGHDWRTRRRSSCWQERKLQPAVDIEAHYLGVARRAHILGKPLTY
jgi:hypothetical protein